MLNDIYTESQIKYLLAIKQLTQNGKPVKGSAIATYLKISRPSVHSMLIKLNDIGLTMKYGSGTLLTSNGKTLASLYSDAFDKVSIHMKKLLPSVSYEAVVKTISMMNTNDLQKLLLTK